MWRSMGPETVAARGGQSRPAHRVSPRAQLCCAVCCRRLRVRNGYLGGSVPNWPLAAWSKTTSQISQPETVPTQQVALGPGRPPPPEAAEGGGLCSPHPLCPSSLSHASPRRLPAWGTGWA